MNLAILQEVHEETLHRFTYKDDIFIWGIQEHWERYDQIPDEGPLVGDCDTFAMAARKALLKRGIKSRLMFVGIDDPRGDHLVLEAGGYILDNTRHEVVSWEVLDYTLISISGEDPVTPWRSINNYRESNL